MDKKQKKENRKGFLRNTAINVVEDIVNMGNPLNPGGHVLGSIADGALMEASDRRMAKKMYKDVTDTMNNKTASEYLDELYMEKTAGIGSAIKGLGALKIGPKALGEFGKQVTNGANRYKQLLTGSNIANLNKDVSNKVNTMRATNYNLNQSRSKLNALNDKINSGAFAGKSEQAMQGINKNRKNLAHDVLNNTKALDTAKTNVENAADALALEQNKVLATRVGTGVAAGVGAKNLLNRRNDEKQASEYLDELYMEKTAGIGNLGKKIADSKFVNMLAHNDTIKRTGELLTGSKARSIANEIKEIEDKKKNLNLFEKMTGKKHRLNRLQNQKYRDFDLEASNVSRARKTAAGGAALGFTGSNIAHTYVRDKRRDPSMPTE